MNYRIIAKLLSVVAAALCFGNIVSLALAWIYRDHPREEGALSGFLWSIALCLLFALGLAFSGRKSGRQMFRKEALTVIGLGWILASVLGALPFVLILDDFSLADGIFESASGFTTTGASVIANVEELPLSLLFWRSMTQWIGGLGVIVFFVAILGFLGAGAKILFSRESSASAAELDSSRIQNGIFRLLYLYLGLSLLCVITYNLVGLDWYEAVNHMFTTISTGGYSTRVESMAAFQNPALEWSAILFMTLGGTSFIVILRFLRGERRQLKETSEVHAYLLILLGTSVLVAGLLLLDGTEENLHDTFRSAAFQVVSIMTTTGYATRDFDQWIPVSHIILLGLMVIGGCSGSTGGGIKVVRLLVGVKVFFYEVEHAYRSHVVRPIRLNGQNVDAQTREGIVSYLMLVTFILFLGTILLALFQPYTSFPGVVSAVFASFFNIGPGFAEVGPTQNFGFLSGFSKILLSLLMILGRLELFAVLVLFSPALWRRY